MILLAGSSSGADEMLPPCPHSPNCVSSRDDDPRHRVDPIPYAGTATAAKEDLLAAIRAFPRATVVSSDGWEVRVEFRTFSGFVDDGVFRIDETGKVIQLRSASRLGYWDFGVNRRRIGSIRAAFEEVQQRGKNGISEKR